MSLTQLRRTNVAHADWRRPSLLQWRPNDCGPRCLAIILHHHGIDTNLAEIRRISSWNLRGTSLLGLSIAASKLGMPMLCVSVNPSCIKCVPLPGIAHVCWNHFVVIRAVGVGGVDMVDPINGANRLDFHHLHRYLTGYMLITRPGVVCPRETGKKSCDDPDTSRAHNTNNGG